MQHRCSCFLVLSLFQLTSFSLSWNLESPAFISASFCCWSKGGNKSLYLGIWVAREWCEWSLVALACGGTRIDWSCSTPPCGKRGLAVDNNLVSKTTIGPFHKRQPSFSLCGRLLVPQRTAEDSAVYVYQNPLLMLPSLPLNRKKRVRLNK